ncbi:signal peptidase II [Actinomyces culturomici]|uniref:signal peptidase II n=1 Tax=Actinomyces culturomici TaxID=1926276 RepID=UPI000E20C6AA|nr:signal peptidase II [Actinomyces culturomici]
MGSTTTRGGSALRTRLLVAGAVALAGVATDQATKLWALASLEEGRPITLIGSLLTLQLTRNSGAAFSLGASSTWIFTVLAVVIVAALVYGLWRISSAGTAAAMGLLIGGALGNLIDRLVQPPAFGHGHVVDFLNYNGFFVGNVADIWIVVAAIWLAFAMTREIPDSEESAGARADR